MTVRTSVLQKNFFVVGKKMNKNGRKTAICELQILGITI
jgi:hypothetical protein